ncbi:MAG: hypothetical protein COA41_01885 [Sphingopyxis sp.]|nr:MAG: hypothetical protein COA41_01885 [Sphingopyxis sp.]
MADMAKPQWYEIAIDNFPQPTGTLSVMEFGTQIPFIVKRVFWVHSVPDKSTERGAHAHEDLSQVIFCAQGSCLLELESSCGRKEAFPLSKDSPAVFVDGRVWRKMRNFSTDCSLIVLCDRQYSEDRVITDYNEFRAQ